MVQGSMSCIKYLIFFFNFLFVICGIAIISVGGVALKNDLKELYGSKYGAAPTLLIVLGVIIFVIAFLGCCGAIKEDYCMIMSFGILMFILFIVTLAGGITAYTYNKDIENFVKQSLNDSFNEENKNNTELWNDMQHALECCGVEGPGDYAKYQKTIPKSCCKDGVQNCDQATAYKDGCSNVVVKVLKKGFSLVGGFGIGVALIELLGCVMAWCLASAIRRDYGGR